jgi:hypothetical protein
MKWDYPDYTVIGPIKRCIGKKSAKKTIKKGNLCADIPYNEFPGDL